MIFVTFLLGVLKLLGLILLALLILFILAVCLIIFVPVKFELRASGFEDFIFHLDMSWLFKAVKYYYYVTDSEKSGLLLFGHNTKSIFARKKKHKKPKKDTASKDDSFHCKEQSDKKVETEFTEKENNNNIQKDDYTESEKKKVNDSTEKNNFNNKKKIKNKKVKLKKSKLKKTKSDNGIFDIINKIKTYPDKDKIINYTLKLLKKLKTAIKFKDAEIYGTIGFDDPSQTGLFLGGVSIISAFLPINFNIKGNFEKEDFNSGIYLKGRFSLWSLGFPILVYILKKPIRKILFGRNDDIE